ncbi:M15 family metallopeptidase [Polaribacter sp. Hel1_85]|uniref:M15 family metallopeptidase n=1 Tax=Polaribacter sp. Hel1_85 TaxID=1250005 RepID=UPI00052B7621|nr:M15 family metallopeptidase [Polaribacter sp. Hel1_85]KGL64254.1 D-alanyl-D-alanine dipeptidase [Polaribacter sp. Hel1_85]
MKKLFFLITFSLSLFSFGQELPEGFVYLSDVDATIQSELRYLSSNNFIGKPIDGYHKNCVIVTKETASALQKIQQILIKKGLSLKIFDAYRPQQSVNHFVRWAKVLSDTIMKQEYYPNVPKSQLFNQGYIASKSGHSRGSTVDLTIVDIKKEKELDMGSPFDFFGEESHPFFKEISTTQKSNRFLLRKVMLENGFKPYDNEWWHFTLKNEPFRNSYFNFPVE